MKIKVTIHLDLEVPDKTALAGDTRILLEQVMSKLREFESSDIDLEDWFKENNKLKGRVITVYESKGTYLIEPDAGVPTIVGVDWASEPAVSVALPRKIKEGWGYPLTARVQHYWNNSVYSLCETWLYTGELKKNVSVADGKVCQTCLKKLIRIKNKENPNE